MRFTLLSFTGSIACLAAVVSSGPTHHIFAPTEIIPPAVVNGSSSAIFTSTSDGLDGPKITPVNSTSWDWWYFDVVSADAQSSAVLLTLVENNIMPSFGNFLHTQLILKIPKPTTSFASKVVIITGASSRLGKETAKQIVRLGASKVILGCRNLSKGQKVKLDIELSLSCNPNIIEVWKVDIKSPTSIKQFVDRVNKLPRLDTLINNAGIQTMKFQVVYGTERTVAVNVIGTFASIATYSEIKSDCECI